MISCQVTRRSVLSPVGSVRTLNCRKNSQPCFSDRSHHAYVPLGHLCSSRARIAEHQALVRFLRDKAPGAIQNPVQRMPKCPASRRSLSAHRSRCPSENSPHNSKWTAVLGKGRKTFNTELPGVSTSAGCLTFRKLSWKKRLAGLPNVP